MDSLVNWSSLYFSDFVSWLQSVIFLLFHSLCLSCSLIYIWFLFHCSAPFNPLHYAIDDKSYITSSSFGDPGDEDYPSMSSDFVTTDPNISYDSYSQPVYPLSSSSKMTSDTSHLYTFPAVAINKQLSAWQCKRFAPPRSQNQRLNPRNKFKYHYDATTLKECLELVQSYKISQQEAERVFQIPRTTIQMKLAQIYPKWVAPPRQTFAKRKTFTAVNRNVWLILYGCWKYCSDTYMETSKEYKVNFINKAPI